METQVFIRINEHKMPEYPSYGHVVMFDGDFDKFKSKVDEIITDLHPFDLWYIYNGKIPKKLKKLHNIYTLR
jgi:hypothetical protein